MMQGDSYMVRVELLDGNDAVVTPERVQDVEITIGHITKTYANGEISYLEGLWGFPISQEESFEIIPSRVKAQARVKWENADVEGVDLGFVNLRESDSKEVL